MLPTYGSFLDQESTLVLAPEIGKNVSLESNGLPRSSSSSDSTCTLLAGLIGERTRDGAAEFFAEGLVVTGIEFDPDVEGEV